MVFSSSIFSSISLILMLESFLAAKGFVLNGGFEWSIYPGGASFKLQPDHCLFILPMLVCFVRPQLNLEATIRPFGRACFIQHHTMVLHEHGVRRTTVCFVKLQSQFVKHLVLWYCRSDPEWLKWHWCFAEWKQKKGDEGFAILLFSYFYFFKGSSSISVWIH